MRKRSSFRFLILHPTLMLIALAVGAAALGSACASGTDAQTKTSSGTGASGGHGGHGGGTSSGTGGGALTDNDDDGFLSDVDCDDNNPDINPGAKEICDGIDNDCNDQIDENADSAPTWYEDKDGDGYGISGVTVVSCVQPDGYAADAGDCNDDDPAYHPGADESDCADSHDYNCDGSTGYADNDNDGFAACEECDDSNATVYPGATELCDGLDNDCNGTKDAPGGEVDNDSDGSLSCEDCDDTDGNNYPGNSEACDGQDNDCNGQADMPGGEVDNDNDGSLSCVDCNDNDSNNFPGNPEICDGLDNNCNNVADFPGELVDADNDNSPSCIDCDENDPNNFPGNTEVCDGQDNNCNNLADAPGGEVDNDNDGSLSCIDCDDNDPNNFPGNTEVCDGQDNNCNNFIDQTEIPVNTLCPPGAHVATSACNGSGGCAIGTCSGNSWADTNGQFGDGCECLAQPALNQGTSCANAITAGSLTDSLAQQTTVTGNTPTQNRAVWYVVNGIDDVDTNGDEFHMDGRFTSNPGSVFRMDVFRGSCGGTVIAQNEATSWDWYTDFPRTSNGCTGPAPCGEGNCKSPEQASYNTCDSDTKSFYVKVYRTGGTATCSTFSVKFSNGVY